VRDILERDFKSTMKNLVFDTTGAGYFDIGKKPPEIADVNAVLAKDGVTKGVKVKSMQEVELPKTVAVYELQISGLG
jgi:hypothetical protein